MKSNCQQVREIPIHFSNRKFGKSKLSFKEQLKYLQHVRRLYLYRYPEPSYLLQFLVIGFLGIAVNIATLTSALWAGFSVKLAIILGIAISLVFNLPDRRFCLLLCATWQNYAAIYRFCLTVCLFGAILTTCPRLGSS